MNLKRFALILSVGLFAASVCSCDKDKDKETPDYDFLTGNVSFDIPAYIIPGDVYTLNPTLAKRVSTDSSTDGFKCIWGIDELSIRDTVRVESDSKDVPYTYVFTVPDTLCSITVKCSLGAEGYYNSTASRSCIIVQPYGENKSLKGEEFQSEDKVFTDGRDGKTYHYSTIGGLDWMAQNLSFEELGKPFANSDAMTDIMGQFYTWDDALLACPEGWRLPTNAEVKDLCTSFTGKDGESEFGILSDAAGYLMVNAYLNDIQLWEFWPKVKINNESKLNMMSAGYATVTDGTYKFSGTAKYATFWTADQHTDSKAYYRMIHVEQPDVLIGSGDKGKFATSVRCVRKAE